MRAGRAREGERMNESDGEERGVIESGHYVHWADKQVAEYIMCMNEEEGTLAACLSPPLSSTPPPPHIPTSSPSHHPSVFLSQVKVK